jgi:hypothetical protein
MKDTWIKKGLAVSAILLFIGVAVAPSINHIVVTASQDNDLVEVTTQACGIKGYGDTTVKLTREQASEVKKLFESIRNRMDSARTEEETIAIFNQAVVELNSFGLLGGLSVEHAQQLVNGFNQYLIVKNLPKEVSSCYASSEYKNYNCHVVGNATNIIPLGFKGFLTRFEILYLIINGFSDSLLSLLHLIFGYIPPSRPFQLPGPVVIGYTIFNFKNRDQIHIPSEGWIEADGRLGKSNISGSFYGDIRSYNTNLGPQYDIRYIGMNSFTGTILNFNGTKYFLGFTPYLATTTAVS